MSNMKDMLLTALGENNESKEDIEEVKTFMTPGKYSYDFTETGGLQDLDVEFDSGYGVENGPRFFVWTADRVYFKQIYDGSESIASVPRNPAEETPSYIGGG